jgi:hypothetical protein
MVRLVAVFIGGMFLDGYILGIIGPVAGSMRSDLQLDARSLQARWLVSSSAPPWPAGLLTSSDASPCSSWTWPCFWSSQRPSSS